MAQETAGRLDIDELKRLHAAATPGEWKPEVPAWNKHRRNCKTAVSSPTGTVLNTVTPKVPRDGVIGNRPPGDCKTAKYIAALHNAFPTLIDRLEAAEAKADEQEAQIEALELDGEEYEKDCKKALVSMASAFNYEWDGDGATADDLREFIQETVREAQAAALREAANLIRQTTPMPISLDPYERGKFDGRMYAVEQLEG